jgi:hypothetical protein
LALEENREEDSGGWCDVRWDVIGVVIGWSGGVNECRLVNGSLRSLKRLTRDKETFGFLWEQAVDVVRWSSQSALNQTNKNTWGYMYASIVRDVRYCKGCALSHATWRLTHPTKIVEEHYNNQLRILREGDGLVVVQIAIWDTNMEISQKWLSHFRNLLLLPCYQNEENSEVSRLSLSKQNKNKKTKAKNRAFSGILHHEKLPKWQYFTNMDSVRAKIPKGNLEPVRRTKWVGSGSPPLTHPLIIMSKRISTTNSTFFSLTKENKPQNGLTKPHVCGCVACEATGPRQVLLACHNHGSIEEMVECCRKPSDDALWKMKIELHGVGPLS